MAAAEATFERHFTVLAASLPASPLEREHMRAVRQRQRHRGCSLERRVAGHPGRGIEARRRIEGLPLEQQVVTKVRIVLHRAVRSQAWSPAAVLGLEEQATQPG